MKRSTMIVLAGLLISTSAASQPYGMGPGMMGDYGYGMGPGMMGGYGRGHGMGPGMMGDYGHGMGPGMMGGYGRGYGMGPGMMGDYGHGMGPGMMGPGMMGQGMMGPGMMGPGNYGYWLPDLTTEQRMKIADVQDEFRRKQWALMQSMHELGSRQNDVDRDGKFDEKAARKSFEAMSDLRKQMFENSLDLRKRIDAVLTPQQRDQLSRRWSGR